MNRRIASYLMTLLGVAMVVEPAAATEYFVSNTGSDTNAGTSTAAPWATLCKVNNFPFAAGDVVRFKRGDTWRGPILPRGGETGCPVTYASYGDGPTKPLFLGSLAMGDAALWTNEGGNIWSGSPPVPSVTGNELLPNPSFGSNANFWTLYYANGAAASVSRTTSTYDSSPASLKVVCSTPGTGGQDIQLFTTPISIVGESFYRLTFRAKATTPFSFPVQLVKHGSPWDGYCRSNSGMAVTIGTSWNTYTIYYEANVTAADARFTFVLGGMPAGATLWLDTLSFKATTGPLLTLDIGNIIFDNATCGTKVWSRSELDAQDKFWYDAATMSVKMYSLENPAAIHRQIEFAKRQHLINLGDVSFGGSTAGGANYVTFEDLALTNGGAHGIWMNNNSGITISNCDLSYLGGGDQFGNDHRLRFGNGVELWDSGHDILVENCHIRQVYDAAITNQGSSTNSQYNLYYRYNTIENCQYGYELWDRSAGSSMDNIHFEHNICRNGGSWGHAQRPDPYGTFVQLYYSEASVPGGIYITDNVFDTAASGALCVNFPWTDLDKVVLDRNVYCQPAGTLLVQWPNYWYYATPADFYWYQTSTGKDTHSVLNPTGCLIGSVIIPGFRGDNTTVGLIFEFQPSGGDEFTREAFLDADGSFRLILPAGTYDITVRSYAALATVLSGVTVSGSPTVLAAPIILKGGDANGDNAVSFEDFSLLQNNYGTRGAAETQLAAAETTPGGCWPMGMLLILIPFSGMRIGWFRL